MKIAVLAGGVGAARFLAGLSQCVDPASITAICNVSDDFEWHGLHVSPDIDTVAYTLAGLEGSEGWGLRDDTTITLDALRDLGEDEWFTVGDGDLATHLWRTDRLRAGHSLAEVTAELTALRGIASTILPVTNDAHPTIVRTAEGDLAFQEYFVRHRAQPRVLGFEFPGAGIVDPAPGVLDAIATADALLIAPSNPFVSIGPMLEVVSVRHAIETTRARRVAVSPIIGGAAVKGPAADMLRSLGHDVSAAGVAALYEGLIDRFVLDRVDADQAEQVRARGMEAVTADTLMTGSEGRRRVAEAVLEAAS